MSENKYAELAQQLAFIDLGEAVPVPSFQASFDRAVANVVVQALPTILAALDLAANLESPEPWEGAVMKLWACYDVGLARAVGIPHGQLPVISEDLMKESAKALRAALLPSETEAPK